VVLHVVENADLAGSSEYLGRVESIQTVLLKPQVPAEIAQVHFKEGSIVKAGQLLFSLDNKQYAATVALRRAELDKATANYERASKYYARLKAADAGSVSAADIDLAQSDVLQGKALVEQAKASLQMAQIDLGYTKITAPITGQIGQAFFTKGNYVTPAGGPLAKIVQIDPIRVGFALPDKDYLQQMKLFRASSNAVYNATIRLANGELYPFKGQRDFEDNTIDDKNRHDYDASSL
jgi:Membrane-fusion protein